MKSKKYVCRSQKCNLCICEKLVIARAGLNVILKNKGYHFVLLIWDIFNYLTFFFTYLSKYQVIRYEVDVILRAAVLRGFVT